MQNDYHDKNGYYTHSLPAAKGTYPPNNATRGKLPGIIPPGKWPQLVNDNYILIDDHRGKDYWHQDGTKNTIMDLGESFPDGVLVIPPPSDFHKTHDGTSWLLNIPAKKEELHNLVQAEKNRVRDRGFLVNGVLFDSDSGARIAYSELGLKLASDPDFSIQNWKASPGVWVTMTASLYAQVVAAGETHLANCFAWQAAKELEIEACTTAEELEAVSMVYDGE